MKNFHFYVIALILTLTFLTGCSGKKNQVPLMPMDNLETYRVPQKINPNQPIQVRTSLNDNRPEWTLKTVFEEGNSIYFTGAYLKGVDYPLTIRCANAETLKSVIQAISQYVRTEFSMFTQGANNLNSGIDRYVEDGIATFTKGLHLQGIRQVESYYEEMFDPITQQTYFNVWVKLEMRKSDYLSAKTGVIRNLRDSFDSAGQIEAKRKAEQLLKDLKGQANAT